MNEDICPYFNSCFVRSIMQSIEVPYLLQYCRQSYTNCRYFSSLVQQGYKDKKMEEAQLV